MTARKGKIRISKSYYFKLLLSAHTLQNVAMARSTDLNNGLSVHLEHIETFGAYLDSFCEGKSTND
jgi:hypothetical protein